VQINQRKKSIVWLDFSSSSSWVGQSDWICDLLVQNAWLTTLLLVFVWGFLFVWLFFFAAEANGKILNLSLVWL